MCSPTASPHADPPGASRALTACEMHPCLQPPDPVLECAVPCQSQKDSFILREAGRACVHGQRPRGWGGVWRAGPPVPDSSKSQQPPSAHCRPGGAKSHPEAGDRPGEDAHPRAGREQILPPLSLLCSAQIPGSFNRSWRDSLAPEGTSQQLPTPSAPLH